jgi:hypothetical protein
MVGTRVILMCSQLAAAHMLAQNAPKPAPQNPSPMTESVRLHGRGRQEAPAGIHLKIDSILPVPVEVFVPYKSQRKVRLRLLFHFHGAAFIAEQAVSRLKGDMVGVSIHLGSGSRAYGDAFKDPGRFPLLLDAIQKSLAQRLGTRLIFDRVILSGFSAGYGAIRAIMSDPGNYARVDAVLLLDGLHAGYVPEGRVLADGGRLNEQDLNVFVKLAQDCSRKESRKRFLITHSEIFPGTFVSTTEASDFILSQLGLKPRPVLAWGPNGMQMLSSARRNRFEVLGFAGNTAPDHMDHLHSLEYFVRELMKL